MSVLGGDRQPGEIRPRIQRSATKLSLILPSSNAVKESNLPVLNDGHTEGPCRQLEGGTTGLTGLPQPHCAMTPTAGCPFQKDDKQTLEEGLELQPPSGLTLLVEERTGQAF